MKVYIASSWKNAHGVELLTAELRRVGCFVYSWVENNFREDHNHVTKKMDFDTWVNSLDSDQSFVYDISGARDCDIFIWYGPPGMDAAAELGVAYAIKLGGSGKKIYGLWAKGEQLGLMRKMVDHWFGRAGDLIVHIDSLMVDQARTD